MKAFKFYIGCIEQDGRYIGPDIVRDFIMRALRACGIDGATLTDATGVWCGAHEPVVVVYVSGIDDDTATEFMRHARTALNQESIGYHEAPTMRFYA